ncbi:MAG: Trk system potassium transporter TrkA [Rubellimicrobium sp.]|nr:Trk system potassium transporter TrkA [Rubellimicrobium sp.]
MKVIICGAGQVGWQIARQLARERHEITVVDTNAALVERATEVLDVTGMQGFASHPDVLERAGADDADMIIAATHSDEVNLVTCQIAHAVFGVSRKIARLRSQVYRDVIDGGRYRRDLVPVDVVISPEHEVAEATLQRLASPAAFDTESFLDGQAMLVGLALDDDCPVVNTSLRQLTDLFSTLKTVVVAIRRDGRMFAPSAEDQMFAGDEVYLVAEHGDLPRSFEIFGKAESAIERLVIIGGGNIGLGVAALVEDRMHMRTRLIERDRARAEAAAEQLGRTVVLNGDGLARPMLDEADVAHAHAVLAVTDDDKANILACVRARQMGARMTICLINDPTLAPLMTPLGIDSWINPRSSTVSSILRHLRHGRVRWVYSIGDGEAEVIEAQVLGTSPIAGHLIRDIEFPPGVLVGAMARGGRYMKPVATTRIEEGDAIVLFAMAADVPEVERLLQVSIDFF